MKKGDLNNRTRTEAFPLVYSVLSSKTTTIYQTFLAQLAHVTPPSTIIMDFEKSAINAFSDAFPTSQIRGCFFHLTQNIYRQFQKLGLQQRYQEDQQLAHQVKLLSSLAFVPCRDVIKRFCQVLKMLPPELQPLAEYFDVQEI